MQSLHPVMMKIPRIFYVILFTAISIAATIAGRERFGCVVSCRLRALHQ